jgi:thiamine kinase-like enzyme
VLHAEPGALVFEFIDGKTLTAEDVRRPEMLARILPLVSKCHREMPHHVTGPALIFWVFHVLRDYGHSLRAAGSRHLAILPGLLGIAADLERAIGAVDIVYGHNDLLPGNLIDDGFRLWLIDWDYAGFNSPLFDLANLCSNNEVAASDELKLLESYFGHVVDAGLLRRYHAMKCASLLRETMWSMISELHSTLDFDYRAYTAENMARFERELADFRKM